jgi:hypothetical protein
MTLELAEGKPASTSQIASAIARAVAVGSGRSRRVAAHRQGGRAVQGRLQLPAAPVVLDPRQAVQPRAHHVRGVRPRLPPARRPPARWIATRHAAGSSSGMEANPSLIGKVGDPFGPQNRRELAEHAGQAPGRHHRHPLHNDLAPGGPGRHGQPSPAPPPRRRQLRRPLAKAEETHAAHLQQGLSQKG